MIVLLPCKSACIDKLYWLFKIFLFLRILLLLPIKYFSIIFFLLSYSYQQVDAFNFVTFQYFLNKCFVITPTRLEDIIRRTFSYPTNQVFCIKYIQLIRISIGLRHRKMSPRDGGGSLMAGNLKVKFLPWS